MLDLNELIKDAPQREPDRPLPTLEEQKEIVLKLKQLEKQGKLTPEVLEEYFGAPKETQAPETSI